MLNVLRQLMARHTAFVLICAVLLAGFQFLICGLVSTVDITGVLEQMKKSAPPFMQSMLGEEFFGTLTSRGMLAFAWSHPITLAMGAAIAIVLAAHGIAGEIESGTMELLLSQPLSRLSYLAAHSIFALSSLMVLSLGGIAGTIGGQNYYELRMFETGALLELSLNYFLLQCAWFGVTLVFSVFGREGGSVARAAFLLALLSYIIQVIGRLLPAASFVLPYSLYNYYSPQAILVELSPVGGSLAVLFVVFVTSLGFVAWKFQRRDIP